MSAETSPQAAVHKPIVRTLLADIETPLSAYWKLAHDETYSFLLESVTGGEQLARFSIIGVRPIEVIRVQGQQVTRETRHGLTTIELESGQDPLGLVQAAILPVEPDADRSLPKFLGGAVGLIGYDYVRRIEDLPDERPNEFGLDEIAMMIQSSVVVFDHARNVIKLIVLTDGTPSGDQAAHEELDRLQARLNQPLPSLPAGKSEPQKPQMNRTQADYEAAVERIRDYIIAGDCIQAVPSVRFQAPCEAHPVTVYRALRSLNPSPYMYCVRFGDLDIVGASPELLVGLSAREARVRPIAGTRPRSADPLDDEALAQELLADEKERAEHVMLVDLGRNDLARVCESGTVTVSDLMVIERYSHVMHIVSHVTGRLRRGLTAVDLIRACFPAGTVSGAPKVRAMQIIDELEPTRRGVYAGAIGYLSGTGDLDLAIAIRTIVIKNKVATVQVGAGIVFDSNPTFEYNECLHKAGACLRALDLAAQGLAE